MTRPFYRSLYAQVLVGILLGVILGVVAPDKGAAMKPLGDGFIKLIKMLIAPIIFATITVGIARMGAMRDVGRIGIRTLVYFEVVSTLALLIGLVVVNVLQPGRGLHVDPTAGAPAAATPGAPTSTVDFLLNIIPTTVLDALRPRRHSPGAGRVAALRHRAAVARRARADAGRRDRAAVARAVRHRRHDHAARADRRVRRHGVHRRQLRHWHRCSSLGKLMAGVYITCLLFIFIVLGTIVRLAGLSPLAAAALHRRRNSDRARHVVVGVRAAAADAEARAARVAASRSSAWSFPTGYSFNLDGTSIYMTMAAVFVAQASGRAAVARASSCRFWRFCC